MESLLKLICYHCDGADDSGDECEWQEAAEYEEDAVMEMESGPSNSLSSWNKFLLKPA